MDEESILQFSQLITKSLEPVDSDQRFFEGYLTVQVKDKQGEVTIVDELYKVLPVWMARGAPISDTHSNRIVGKGINFAKANYESPDGDIYPAIKITGMIHKDYELDNEIWSKIKTGEYKGLSFGGATKADREPMRMKDGSIAYALSKLEHYEVAVCKEPAVPLAVITDYNQVAKSFTNSEKRDDKLVIRCNSVGCFIEKNNGSNGQEKGVSRDEESISHRNQDESLAANNPTADEEQAEGVEKGENITKPIPDGKGGSGSFQQCVNNNKDKDNPEGWCGAIQQKLEKSDAQKYINTVDMFLSKEEQNMICPTCNKPLSEHGITKDSPYGTDTSTNFSQMPDSPRVSTEKEEVEKKNKKTIQQVESQLIIDGKHKPQNIHHGQKKETRMSDLYESEANAIKSSDKLKSQFIADEIKTMLSKKKTRPETPNKENKYQTHIDKPIHFNALKEIIEDKKRKKEEEAKKGRHGAEFYLPKRGHKVEEPEEDKPKKEKKKTNALGKLLSQMGKRKRGKKDVLYDEEKKAIIDNALKFVRKPSSHSPVGAEGRASDEGKTLKEVQAERAKKRLKNPRSYQSEKRILPTEADLDKLIAQINARNKKPKPKFDALELSSVLSGKKGKKKIKSLDDIIKRKRSSPFQKNPTKPKPRGEGYSANSAILAESKLPDGMTLAEFQTARKLSRQKDPWQKRMGTLSRREAKKLPDEDALDKIIADKKRKKLEHKTSSLGDIKDKLSRIKRKIEEQYSKDHPYEKTDKARPQSTGDKIIDEMPKTLERLLLEPLGIKQETTGKKKNRDHSNSQGDAHRMYTQEASQDTWIGSGLPQPKKTESDEDDEEFGVPIEQGLPHNGDARQKGEEGTGSIGGLIRHNVGDGSTFAQGSGNSAQITNNKLNNQMRGNKYMPRSVKRKPKTN